METIMWGNWHRSTWNILVAAKAPLSSPSTSHHCLGASLLQALFSGFQASAQECSTYSLSPHRDVKTTQLLSAEV